MLHIRIPPITLELHTPRDSHDPVDDPEHDAATGKSHCHTAEEHLVETEAVRVVGVEEHGDDKLRQIHLLLPKYCIFSQSDQFWSKEVFGLLAHRSDQSHQTNIWSARLSVMFWSSTNLGYGFSELLKYLQSGKCRVPVRKYLFISSFLDFVAFMEAQTQQSKVYIPNWDRDIHKGCCHHIVSDEYLHRLKDRDGSNAFTVTKSYSYS